jgi:hypothetical protein
MEEEPIETKRTYNDIYSYVPKIGKPILLGSASNPNVRYITDYDLYCKITEKDLKKISKIEKMEGRYLVDVKVEGESKTNKFVKRRTLDTSNLSKLFFVKLDYIIWVDYTLREMSIIYDLNPKKEDFEDNLRLDIEDYVKDKNYFKAVKRMYSLAKFQKDTKKAKKLLDFINKSGELGSALANLNAIELVTDNKEVPKKLVAVNLKELGIKKSEITETITRIQKKLNSESKQAFF